MYRDLGPQGWSPWTEFPFPPPGYSLDLESGALRTEGPSRSSSMASQKARPIYKEIDAIQLSECYLAMLTWVMAQEVSNSLSSARQFAVIMSTGHGATHASALP